jgi:hypothetical protein
MDEGQRRKGKISWSREGRFPFGACIIAAPSNRDGAAVSLMIESQAMALTILALRIQQAQAIVAMHRAAVGCCSAYFLEG